MEPKQPKSQQDERAEHRLRDSVLTRIRSDAVSMRPRFYFILRIALAIALALLVFLVSALVFNFVLFHVGAHGRLPLVGFGAHGILLFLYLFPWPLVLVDVAFMLALWMLIRKSAFVYRNPGVYPLALLVVLVALFGALVYVHGGVNTAFREQAHRGNLPSDVDDFFEPRHGPPPGGARGDAFHGTVGTTTVEPVSFILIDTRASSSYTVIPDTGSTAWPPLHEGEQVVVGGTLVRPDLISAFGVRVLGASQGRNSFSP
jgi:hypothetical protein